MNTCRLVAYLFLFYSLNVINASEDLEDYYQLISFGQDTYEKYLNAPIKKGYKKMNDYEYHTCMNNIEYERLPSPSQTDFFKYSSLLDEFCRNVFKPWPGLKPEFNSNLFKRAVAPKFLKCLVSIEKMAVSETFSKRLRVSITKIDEPIAPAPETSATAQDAVVSTFKTNVTNCMDTYYNNLQSCSTKKSTIIDIEDKFSACIRAHISLVEIESLTACISDLKIHMETFKRDPRYYKPRKNLTVTLIIDYYVIQIIRTVYTDSLPEEKERENLLQEIFNDFTKSVVNMRLRPVLTKEVITKRCQNAALIYKKDQFVIQQFLYFGLPPKLDGSFSYEEYNFRNQEYYSLMKSVDKTNSYNYDMLSKNVIHEDDFKKFNDWIPIYLEAYNTYIRRARIINKFIPLSREVWLTEYTYLFVYESKFLQKEARDDNEFISEDE